VFFKDRHFGHNLGDLLLNIIFLGSLCEVLADACIAKSPFWRENVF
jgi:hypothetical protein